MARLLAPDPNPDLDDADRTEHAYQQAVALSIGNRVRQERRRLGVTLDDAAEAARISSAMLSRIENAHVVPSMRTLSRLSQALTIPMSEFFHGLEDDREATHVKAGQGIRVTRRGRTHGHQYEIVALPMRRRRFIEPWMSYIPDLDEEFPFLQAEGTGFVHMLEGRMVFRCGRQAFDVEPGDSVLYDLAIPHRPEPVEVPIRFLHISLATEGSGSRRTRRLADPNAVRPAADPQNRATGKAPTT